MRMDTNEGWKARIIDINHRGDYMMPVLCYELIKGGSVIGRVDIISSHMLISARKSGAEAEFWTVDSASYVLDAIKKKMSEGIPPGIADALETMSAIRKTNNIVDAESAKETFGEIRSGWEKLILSCGISVQKSG